MNTGLLLGALGASFVGSLHCAGMCGPLVVFCGAGERSDRRALVAYHTARITGYMLLGGLAGSVGAALDLGGDALGLTRVASVLAGLTMVGIGLSGLFGVMARARSRKACVEANPALRQATRSMPLRPSWGARFKARLSARVMPLMGRAHQWSPLKRSLWIGALTALLPCGWLFAFLVVAAGSGSAWQGSMVMLMLGLGSVPVLLGLGLGANSLLAPLARRSPGIVAALLLVMGLLTISGRLAAPSFAQTMSTESLPERLWTGALREETLPCCSSAAEPNEGVIQKGHSAHDHEREVE